MQRLRGKRVKFVTGTDEHGEKIALAAAARGMAPQEHCDDIVAAYKQLWAEVGAGGGEGSAGVGTYSEEGAGWVWMHPMSPYTLTAVRGSGLRVA